MAKTVRRKSSVEFVAEYGRFELQKRTGIGVAIGLLCGWLLWGG
jgi:hypothetical protein